MANTIKPVTLLDWASKQLKKTVRYATKEVAAELLLLGTVGTINVLGDNGDLYQLDYVEIDDTAYITKQTKKDDWYERSIKFPASPVGIHSDPFDSWL